MKKERPPNADAHPTLADAAGAQLDTLCNQSDQPYASSTHRNVGLFLVNLDFDLPWLARKISFGGAPNYCRDPIATYSLPLVFLQPWSHRRIRNELNE